mmetsp:Transcript_23159/g.26232  ORF Transcript_23159/g.26232 Transcript_23159/m.26232 type:complete len:99 (+) Transcript_23159:181-477(+)
MCVPVGFLGSDAPDLSTVAQDPAPTTVIACVISLRLVSPCDEMSSLMPKSDSIPLFLCPSKSKELTKNLIFVMRGKKRKKESGTKTENKSQKEIQRIA